MEWYKQRGRISVTITSNKYFVISTAATREYFHTVQHVFLGYESETGKVAIKPLLNNIDGSVQLYRNNRADNCRMYAGTFLSKNGIEHFETIRYDAYWDEKLKALVFIIADGRSNE